MIFTTSHHILALILTLALLHFIFIDLQRLIHRPTHLPSVELSPESINQLRSKTNEDLKDSMITSINDTLRTLRTSLSKLKSTEKESVATPLPTPPLPSIVSNPPRKQDKKKDMKAALFTMDSIASYERNSLHGGASGELIIRHALEDAFRYFDVSLRIIRSDEEFSRTKLDEYDLVILDSWTWAAKGWVPKPNILRHEKKVYILDFFGSSRLRGNSLAISVRSQILTAFPSPWNQFLGYYISSDRTKLSLPRKDRLVQGVIWGKDPKYYQGKEMALTQVANAVKLVSTATQTLFHHRNVEWRGHQSNDDWLKLLATSKFLLGLGDPLLGPSAVDAISLGCMFINPIYKSPKLEAQYSSQHDYIQQQAPDYVCSYREDNVRELLACVKRAMESDLKPFIPSELTKKEYFERVKTIFQL